MTAWTWTQTESDPCVWEYTHEGRKFAIIEHDARWVDGKRYGVFVIEGDETVEYSTLATAMSAASRSINRKHVSHRTRRLVP